MPRIKKKKNHKIKGGNIKDITILMYAKKIQWN